MSEMITALRAIHKTQIHAKTNASRCAVCKTPVPCDTMRAAYEVERAIKARPFGIVAPNDAIKAREPIKHEEWCKCECGAQGGESL